MNAWRAALLFLCLSVLGAALATAPAAAGEPAGRAVVASATVSMDQAVKMVEQRYRARVVKAETHKDNGRTVYVLKLLDDSGKVWTVRVDASDGSVQ
jgi:uncharacterized membrane protein YkoI